MTPDQWSRLISAMHNVNNIEEAVAAAKELQRIATDADVPRLLETLKDSSFFVREAVAWPLSDLGRVDALPELLGAYDRGLEEGHDNDGFSAALIDLVSTKPEAARLKLRELAAAASGRSRETIQWLQEFCDAPT